MAHPVSGASRWGTPGRMPPPPPPPPPLPPLPPLPPAFRVTDADVRPGGRDMLAILDDDHERFVLLCESLLSAGRLVAGRPAAGADGEVAMPAALRRRPGVNAVVDVLVATLTRHLSAEEQYLYPTVCAVLPDGGELAGRELGEHRAIARSLRELYTTRPDAPAYRSLAITVYDQLRRHVDRASQEIFPRVRERCTDNELIRLGNRVQIAVEAAPTRPHPAAPVRPPANKLVDPALGVVDKVRDALAFRRTRFEQLNM